MPPLAQIRTARTSVHVAFATAWLALMTALPACDVRIQTASAFACAGADGTPCDDGDPCTHGDQCVAGACTPMTVVCFDGTQHDAAGTDTRVGDVGSSSGSRIDTLVRPADASSGASSGASGGAADAGSSGAANDGTASSGGSGGLDSSGGVDAGTKSEDSGAICIDTDGDGYGSGCAKGTDCDDTNPLFAAVCPDCSKSNFPGCPCKGTKVNCYSGPAETLQKGICQAGIRSCKAVPGTKGFMAWGACLGEVVPQTEVCDKLDNDCDGITDEAGPNACDNCDAKCVAAAIGKGAPTPFFVAPGARNTAVNAGALVFIKPPESWPDVFIGYGNDDTVGRFDGVKKKEAARYRVCKGGKALAVGNFGDGWVGCQQSGEIARIARSKEHCVDKNGDKKLQTSADSDGNGLVKGNEILGKGADECVLFIETPKIGKKVAGVAALAIDERERAWTLPVNASSVFAIGPGGGDVVATAALGCKATMLTADPAGHLWAAGGTCTNLRRVDVATGVVGGVNGPASFDLGKLRSLALGGGGDLWTVNGTTTVARINAAAAWGTITVPDPADAIVSIGGQKAAVASVGKARIRDVTLPIGGSGAFSKPVQLAATSEPLGLALGQKYLWTSNHGSASLTAIAVGTGSKVTIKVGSQPRFAGDASGLQRRARLQESGVVAVQRLLHVPVPDLVTGAVPAVRWDSVTLDLGNQPAGSVQVSVRAGNSLKELAAKPWLSLGKAKNATPMKVPGKPTHGYVLEVLLRARFGASSGPTIARIQAKAELD